MNNDKAFKIANINVQLSIWKRRGWDSNPRWSYPHSGFRDRPVQPLQHLSKSGRPTNNVILFGIALSRGKSDEKSNEIELREVRRLILPTHHEVLASDVSLKRLGAVLAVAYEKDFHDFAQLLLLEKHLF